MSLSCRNQSIDLVVKGLTRALGKGMDSFSYGRLNAQKRSFPLRVSSGKSGFCFFFSIGVFFHEHSRSTGQQGKGEGIYLTPLYHFHPLHRHLDIGRAITAGSSPLRIAGSRTRTWNLWFPSASR